MKPSFQLPRTNASIGFEVMKDAGDVAFAHLLQSDLVLNEGLLHVDSRRRLAFGELRIHVRRLQYYGIRRYRPLQKGTTVVRRPILLFLHSSGLNTSPTTYSRRVSSRSLASRMPPLCAFA